jgi:NADPH:quinone reductase-like Zn-dependent oxidoreductase
MADAAALPTAGMAALDLLEKNGFKTGDTVLIVGATGGVGQFLTQLASQHGTRVIATGTHKDEAMLKGDNRFWPVIVRGKCGGRS